MKRSDLTRLLVLGAVHNLGPNAWDFLVAVYPAALVDAAYAREVRAGHLDYGVSARMPWLTSKGKSALFDASVAAAHKPAEMEQR
jgi:hypothetical protein